MSNLPEEREEDTWLLEEEPALNGTLYGFPKTHFN